MIHYFLNIFIFYTALLYTALLITALLITALLCSALFCAITGIEIDASNQSLWSALRACQEANEADKKTRFAAAAIDRMKETERLKRMEIAKENIKKAQIEEEKEIKKEEAEAELSGFFSEIAEETNTKTKTKIKNENNDSGEAESKYDAEEEDLLSGFFSEVQEDDKAKTEKIEKLQSEQLESDENFQHEKYTMQDLGDRMAQYERLMEKNYEWRNLNPYFVLQLDIDATAEDIKQRYRF